LIFSLAPRGTSGERVRGEGCVDVAGSKLFMQPF
jgi:hypothetical protein